MKLALATIFAFLATVFAATTLTPAPAHAASFSCMNLSDLNASERRVCRSSSLSALDERLDSWYRRALIRAKYFDDTDWIRSQQRAWLRQRNTCNARYWCLRRAYKRQIRKLKNYVEHV